MKPLQQWICDTCGQFIEKPEQGVLEWRSESGKLTARICHDGSFSPEVANPEHCFVISQTKKTLNLNHLAGADGQVRWLGELTEGSVEAWAEIYRRLFVPNYEFARRFFEDAEKVKFFNRKRDDYTQDWLKRVIREYRGAVER